MVAELALAVGVGPALDEADGEVVGEAVADGVGVGVGDADGLGVGVLGWADGVTSGVADAPWVGSWSPAGP